MTEIESLVNSLQLAAYHEGVADSVGFGPEVDLSRNVTLFARERLLTALKEKTA